MNTTADKNAEFARLFSLFEKIATRQSHESDKDTKELIRSLDDTIPKDLEPVVRNLVSLVDTHPHAYGRARRNTVAGSAAPQGMQFSFGSDADSRFTFKMMLHRLYEVEDWGKKVQDVLNQSQKVYKSLEETQKDTMERVKTKVPTEPRVRFDKESAIARGRRTSIAGRTRSHTVSGAGKPPKELLSSLTKRDTKVLDPPSPTQWRVPSGNDVRITKKRCVGRRPSATGERKHWVYASAASSVEIEERTLSMETLALPELPNICRKYGVLQEEGQARTSSMRRRVISMDGEALGNPSFGRKRRSSGHMSTIDHA